MRIELSADEQAQIAERTRAAQASTARLGRGVPDAVPAGDLTIDGPSVAYANFVEAGRNDFLLKNPEGLRAHTWDGQPLWQSPEMPSAAERRAMIMAVDAEPVEPPARCQESKTGSTFFPKALWDSARANTQRDAWSREAAREILADDGHWRAG